MSNWSGKKAAMQNLCAKYGNRCAYCNDQVKKTDRTIDHYMPRSLGGSNGQHNLRLACLSCNGAKGDMHPSDWEKVKPARKAEQVPVKIQLLVLAARRAMEFERRKAERVA